MPDSAIVGRLRTPRPGWPRGPRVRGVRFGTLGADKGYDSGPFCLALEQRGITPHVATKKTTRDPDPLESCKGVRPHEQAAHQARLRMIARLGEEAYAISQRVRKKIEEGFGWMKVVAGLDRGRFAEEWKLQGQFEITAAAYDLVRLRRLLPA